MTFKFNILKSFLDIHYFGRHNSFFSFAINGFEQNCMFFLAINEKQFNVTQCHMLKEEIKNTFYQITVFFFKLFNSTN